MTNESEKQQPSKASGRRPRSPRPGGRSGAKHQNVRARQQPAGGKRHQGRVLAVQLLYEVDLRGHGGDEAMARTFDEEPVPPPVREHVARLVRGVLDHQSAIDSYIAEAAPAFPVAQLPVIDRNVLRLAIFELLHEPKVPPKAVINEAVELAKRFGGDNSGRFVNGVLGTVLERLPARDPTAALAGSREED